VCESVESSSNGIVPFAFRIGTQGDENAAGYSYVTEELLAPQSADPLSDIRGQLSALLSVPALLSAPSADDESKARPPRRGR
jgi:hypothetical protein